MDRTVEELLMVAAGAERMAIRGMQLARGEGDGYEDAIGCAEARVDLFEALAAERRMSRERVEAVRRAVPPSGVDAPPFDSPALKDEAPDTARVNLLIERLGDGCWRVCARRGLMACALEGTDLWSLASATTVAVTAGHDAKPLLVTTP